MFDFDFVKEFGSDDVLAVRFTIRVKSDPSHVRVRYFTDLTKNVQLFAESLAKDEDVIACACEYLYTVDSKHLCFIMPVKGEDNYVTEVD